MSQQQHILFAETMAAMKKAVKRKACDSEEEDPIEQLTNRGNKLRKHARYVREGQMALPNGPEIYKKTIEHAGYQRDTISERPRLLDDNGSELESDDEDDEERQAAQAAAMETYPYQNVLIEETLAPLASAADLPSHPTLSRPFESKILTGLAQEACQMVHKEKNSLWKMKRLLRRLCGDDPWIPCELFETDHDLSLFSEMLERTRNENVHMPRHKKHNGLATENSSRSDLNANQHEKSSLNSHAQTENDNAAQDFPMADAISTNLAGEAHATESGDQNTNSEQIPDASKSKPEELLKSRLGHEDAEMAEAEQANNEHAIENENGHSEADNVEGQMEEEIEPAIPRRMRTRAQAHAVSDDTNVSHTRSSTPESQSDHYIHPYFLAPPNSHPSADFGLPVAEAADARRLLQLYIQKQEEVCRGAQKLYDGLLRADRMRKDVMKWAKAEAHIGEMSDGEDWYDKEEWGLDEDLAKGHDDEEEETTTTNQKKTRARRV